MRLIDLIIKDFLSIQSAKITFRGSGLVLVDGWNYDDSSANGAGKSAVVGAISFALFGKLPRKITVSEIPREGSKTCIVSLNFETNDGTYALVRSKANQFTLQKDSVVIPANQETINALIGLNYEQFCLVALCPQGAESRFLGLSDTNKKDFLVGLLDLSSIEMIKDKIDLAIKTTQKDVDAIDKKSAQIEAKIQVYQNSKRTPPIRQDTSTLIMELHEIEKFLSSADISKYNDLYDVLTQELMEAQEKLSIRSSLESELQNIDNMIEVLHAHEPDCIICPSCQSSVVVNKTATVTREQYQARLQIKLENLYSQRNDAENKLSDAGTISSEAIQALKERISKCSKKKQETLSTQSAAQQTHRTLLRKMQEIETHNKSIEAIEIANQKYQQMTLDALVELDAVNAHLTSLKLKIERLAHAKAIFVPTGLPAYVLDNVITMLNERVSQYLLAIWPSSSFIINTFKETKQGEIRAKFSETLTIMGMERSIGALSGGEYRLLSLAVDLAIIDVFYTMSGASWPLICLDEAFGGLDSANREKLMPLLVLAAAERELWVIDHATEFKTLFEDSIFIEKRNKVSAVI